MKTDRFSRRRFLQQSLALAAGGPLALTGAGNGLFAAEAILSNKSAYQSRPLDAKVAIVPCRSYGAEVDGALVKCLDLLGGIGSLVKNKTVTVKLNLTGTDFSPFLGRPVGETFMTSADPVAALKKLRGKLV